MSYKTLAGQLVNLQKENPLARAVNPTKTVWDVGLRLNCGRIVCLRTHLPTGFPERAAPHMEIVLPATIQARAQHPWLDAQMRVVAMADLNNWGKTRQKRLIGPILKKAMQHFISSPPTLVPLNVAQYGYPRGAPRGHTIQQHPRGRPVHGYPRGLPEYPGGRPAPQYPGAVPRGQPLPQYPGGSPRGQQPLPQYPGGRPNPQYPAGMQQQQPPPYNYPGRPAPAPRPPPKPALRLKEINSMSKKLLRLVRDDLKAPEDEVIIVNDLMRGGLKEVADKHDQHLKIVQENAKIAAENLKLRNEQDALKADLQALQQQVHAKHGEYMKVKQQLIEFQRTMTPGYALQTVSASVEELDAQCSAMADDFVFDDMELKEFETEFLKARELYHKRNALLELRALSPPF